MIASNPGINQLELARMKNVGKASVTKALKILEDEGLIKRKIDEKDKRSCCCYITENGQEIVDDLVEIKAKAEEALFRGFEYKEIKLLYRYLKTLNENAKDLVKCKNY